MENNYSYFENKQCEYFPCHKAEGEFFNCLFCYCPLYALGDKCGGNFTYTPDGLKDCTNCTLPHSENGYTHIISKCPGLAELAKKEDDPDEI